MRDLLGLLRGNERMSESLIFLSKKRVIARKTDEQIPSPAFSMYSTVGQRVCEI